MQTLLPLEICAARDLTKTLRAAAMREQKVGTVLSIEDPGFLTVAQQLAQRQPPLDSRQAQQLRLAHGLAPRLQEYYAFAEDPRLAPQVSEATRAVAALAKRLQQTIVAVQDVALRDYAELRSGPAGTVFFLEPIPVSGTGGRGAGG